MTDQSTLDAIRERLHAISESGHPCNDWLQFADHAPADIDYLLSLVDQQQLRIEEGYKRCDKLLSMNRDMLTEICRLDPEAARRTGEALDIIRKALEDSR